MLRAPSFAWKNIGNIFGCDSDKIALKSVHGKYVVAEINGEANVNRPAMDAWELWTVIELGGDNFKTQLKKCNYPVIIQ